MDTYAVIKTGGKQYRVSEGELLNVEKLDGSKGDSVIFDNVLMVAKEGDIRVGKPAVTGAKVVCEIIAQMQGPKIYVFHMKRRKGFHKKTGHRQQLTRMRIKEISI